MWLLGGRSTGQEVSSGTSSRIPAVLTTIKTNYSVLLRCRLSGPPETRPCSECKRDFLTKHSCFTTCDLPNLGDGAAKGAARADGRLDAGQQLPIPCDGGCFRCFRQHARRLELLRLALAARQPRDEPVARE
jgi:hypothetical protein